MQARQVIVLLTVLCGSVLTVGCEGGASDGRAGGAGGPSATCSEAGVPSSGNPDREKAYCDALATRSACPGGAEPCGEDGKCIYGRLMLPNVFEAYARCRSAPSCRSDDDCLGDAILAAEGTAVTRFRDDCLAKRSACGNGFNADRCAPGFLGYSCGESDAKACLALACDRIEACLKELPILKAIAACK